MKRIMITGSAASGKSELTEKLYKELSGEGRPVYRLTETATELLKAGFKTGTREFQLQLFRLQTAREEIYGDYIRSVSPAEDALLLIDRGLLDGGVYIPGEEFESVIAECGTTRQAVLESYDAVIQLQSSAGVLGYVRKENNKYRVETDVEECLRQDAALRQIYSSHPGYRYIKAAEKIEEKYAGLLAAVKAAAYNGN